MKKRKELDALLTKNMANGKKNGKSKRAKEGHELLRLDSDSNSSDNEELFLAPKKTVVRRPRQCQCCSMCVPLIMFILTMGCIVVTGGLIWMHFNLKQDLDDLRQKLDKVTIKAESAASQEKTIMDLESRLQGMSDVPGKVDVATNNIVALNSSFRGAVHDVTSRLAELEKLRGRVEMLESKAPSTSASELPQTVADNGNKIEELLGKAAEHHDSIAAQSADLQKLRDDVNTLQTQVADLQHPAIMLPSTTTPPLPPTPSSTTKSTTTPKTNSGSGDAAQLHVLSEEIQEMWNAVHNVNATVVVLQSEHQDLASTVAGLQLSLENKTVRPAAPTPRPVQPTTVQPPPGHYDLAQMKADIELLKLECNRSAESVPTAVVTPQDAGIMNDMWMKNISDRVIHLEERVNKLNPGDLNNNLLNANTTRGIQTLLEGALAKFREENLADFTVLRDNVTVLQTELVLQDSFQDEVGIRLAALGDEVKSLQEDCAVCRQTGPAGPLTNPTSPPSRSIPQTSGALTPSTNPSSTAHDAGTGPGNPGTPPGTR